MTSIETRIKERGYQTPGRARAAISMSKQIKAKERDRLFGLVDEWEAEGMRDVVVAGMPASAVVETQVESPPGPRRLPASSAPAATSIVNLNARIRARLTPYGISVLYGARSEVAIPADLLERQGVWETELWQFMIVMARAVSGDEPVTEKFEIELCGQ